MDFNSIPGPGRTKVVSCIFHSPETSSQTPVSGVVSEGFSEVQERTEATQIARRKRIGFFMFRGFRYCIIIPLKL